MREVTDDEPDLAEALEFVRTLNDKQLTACLFNGDHEVTVAGYRPVTIRNWKLTDTPSLAFVVRFGPYGAPIEYDRYAILAGDTAKVVVPETSPCRFPPGFGWDWHFELTPDGLLDEAA
jgi:hypothetical protein